MVKTYVQEFSINGKKFELVIEEKNRKPERIFILPQERNYYLHRLLSNESAFASRALERGKSIKEVVENWKRYFL